MDQNDISEAFPYLTGAEDGEKRTDRGAGGQHPETLGIRQLPEDEESGRAGSDKDAVAGPEMIQFMRQRACGHRDEIELQHGVVRRIHKRIGTCDDLTANLPGDAGELPGDEGVDIGPDLQ